MDSRSGRPVQEIETLRKKLVDCLPDVEAVAALIKSLAGKLPQFHRETEFIGLTSANEFALYDGDIASTDGGYLACGSV